MTSVAHKLFCYGPHRHAVESFLNDLGSNATLAGLQEIWRPQDIAGLRHINFVTVTAHPDHIPDGLFKALMDRGAVIIMIDDQARRKRAHAISMNRKGCPYCAERYPVSEGLHHLPGNQTAECHHS